MKIKPDNTLKSIASRAFPDYKGRKFSLKVNETVDIRSYWDGGSRSYFVLMRLDNGAMEEAPAQSMFDTQISGADRTPTTPNVIIVEHIYFCGKDLGIRFHIHPSLAPRFLPSEA